MSDRNIPVTKKTITKIKNTTAKGFIEILLVMPCNGLKVDEKANAILKLQSKNKKIVDEAILETLALFLCFTKTQLLRSLEEDYYGR